MRMLIVTALCAALVLAAPQGHSDAEEPTILKQSFSQNKGNGSYKYAYELSNGESKQESAQLKNGYLVIRGSFTQIDPVTGEQQTIHYVADKNGFHPEGAHLPA